VGVLSVHRAISADRPKVVFCPSGGLTGGVYRRGGLSYTPKIELKMGGFYRGGFCPTFRSTIVCRRPMRSTIIS